MRKTGFECVYGLFDTTAREDSIPTTAYNQNFGSVVKVKDDIESEDYATLEQDYFLLNGTYPELPDAPQDVVFFSSEMSGEDGAFAENPTMQVSFTEKHSSCGLTFYFVGEPPEEMRIKWYDIHSNLIADATFAVDSQKYLAWKQVENYTKLLIEFTKAKPYRYVKLRYIEYGTRLLCGGDGLPVKDASLIEECSPISDKIAVNKLSFKLIDENNDFNIGNMSGLHKVLQNGQECTAYETVNGEQLLLGRFFLDGHGTDKNVTDISCVDFKGLLDNAIFRGGKVYDGDLAGPVIAQIMETAGISDYTVDDATRAVRLYGWLKNQTCRKALREVLFAAGAVADSSRRSTFDIYIPGRKVQSTIKRTRKFSTSVENLDYISDVSVKFPVYTLNSAVKQILKGTYQPGTYTVDLSSPAEDMTIAGGIITEQTNNYVSFQVAAAGEVIISGKKYVKEDLTVTVAEEKVSAGHVRAGKSFTCTLLDVASAQAAAARLLDYYSLRLGIKIKFLNDGDRPVDWAEIQNQHRIYGSYLAGLEKVTTDLTGGFVSTAQLRGYYKLAEDFYYTGELFAGEDFGGI